MVFPNKRIARLAIFILHNSTKQTYNFALIIELNIIIIDLTTVFPYLKKEVI